MFIVTEYAALNKFKYKMFISYISYRSSCSPFTQYSYTKQESSPKPIVCISSGCVMLVKS